ncbi:MAG: hypothetical protein LC802_06515 [Acidobacteria bacterium]|nr:hypothetical protein [Acidobacteriota bacterium]
MRSRPNLASQLSAVRTRKAFGLLRQASRLALSAILLSQCLLGGGAGRVAAQVRRAVKKSAPATSKSSTPATTTTASAISTTTLADNVPAVAPQQPEFGQLPSEPLAPIEARVVSFKQLSEMLARNPARSGDPAQQQAIHSPGSRPEPDAPATSGREEIPSAVSVANSEISPPNVASPSPSQSFLAQEDGPKIGTTTFTIPPDTHGAVGLDKVFTQTNSNFRIHNKLTGVPLSTVNAETFWSATGGTGVFDPRIVYDPFQNRWITCIVSNASSANSSVLIGVSNTSDPQGTYLLYRVVVGVATGSAAPFANGGWADFPMLGFNKNWVAIGYNMHAITNNAFIRGEVLVLDYPNLRAGTLSGTRVNAGSNFCIHPATTLSATEETLYLVEHFSSAAATVVVGTIKGTPASASVSLFGPFTRPGGAWTNPGGDLLPQDCVAGSPIPTFTCPATPRKLETQDAQVRGNVVFRNGKIWYAQTVALPAGGLVASSHTVAQWTAMTPTQPTPTTLSIAFSDGGRVEDPTATATNGGKWYAYPSIAVNKNDSVILGFSEFESDDFVDAAYSFREAGDAAGTMRDPVVFKDGEDYYEKTFSGTRNRFGDYSHAVVDPANDTDLWTIQEYAQPRVVTPANPNGLQSNDSRWSTWWAKIGLAVPGAAGDLVISEYRLRGTGGDEDEYVEIYNKTSSAITVTTTDGSAGYALAASDGIVRFTIPNGAAPALSSAGAASRSSTRRTRRTSRPPPASTPSARSARPTRSTKKARATRSSSTGPTHRTLGSETVAARAATRPPSAPAPRAGPLWTITTTTPISSSWTRTAFRSARPRSSARRGRRISPARD